jgi:hypothetical protein
MITNNMIINLYNKIQKTCTGDVQVFDDFIKVTHKLEFSNVSLVVNKFVDKSTPSKYEELEFKVKIKDKKTYEFSLSVLDEVVTHRKEIFSELCALIRLIENNI